MFMDDIKMKMMYINDIKLTVTKRIQIIHLNTVFFKKKSVIWYCTDIKSLPIALQKFSVCGGSYKTLLKYSIVKQIPYC